MIYSPKFPIELDDTYVYANVKNVTEAVNFHLKNLLLTFPGERLSNQTYGIGIQKYLFEPILPAVINSMESEVESAIREYIGYISALLVQVIPNEDNNSVKIKIRYSIANLVKNEDFMLEVTPDTTNF